MKNHRVCVVIPVHNQVIKDTEKASLYACKQNLSVYPSYLIHPAGMDISQYLEIHQELISLEVPQQWLSTKSAYNRMKMNPEFYSLFPEYSHMLTYELDAYVFGSEFSPFMNFDFIGAPLFSGFNKAEKDSAVVPGCNSGFSLRNIQSCLNVLQQLPQIRKKWKWFHYLESNLSILRPWLKSLPWNREKVFEQVELAAFFKGKNFHEDMIWTLAVPILFPWFKVADTVSAYKFSFEVNPDVLFEWNNRELSLGCHAWPLFPHFWRQHIPALL